MSSAKQVSPKMRETPHRSSAGKGRTLVTGGAGFIGSHLAAHLAIRGDDVVVLDNFSTGHRENLDGIPVQLVEGDIRDFSCLTEVMQGVDTVYHQAALCSVARSVEDPIATHTVNATGTLNIFEAARRAGVRRVVFASSSSVYGDSETLPKHELMPTAPLSPYAISKLMGEHYGDLYWRLFGLETVALRYFNVFGPRQDPQSEYAAVIPRFLQRILDHSAITIFGDGSQTRDFTYVANVVQANIAAANSPQAPGQVFNIACGCRWSLLELVERLEAMTQRKADIEFHQRRAGDILHSLASINRARKLLGYSPSVDFAEGISETVDWFIHSNANALASHRGSKPAALSPRHRP